MGNFHPITRKIKKRARWGPRFGNRVIENRRQQPGVHRNGRHGRKKWLSKNLPTSFLGSRAACTPTRATKKNRACWGPRQRSSSLRAARVRDDPLRGGKAKIKQRPVRLRSHGTPGRAGQARYILRLRSHGTPGRAGQASAPTLNASLCPGSPVGMRFSANFRSVVRMADGREEVNRVMSEVRQKFVIVTAKCCQIGGGQGIGIRD